MHDRQVSATTVLAWLGWTIGFALIVADLFLTSDDIGHLGMAIAAIGAVFHVRAMLIHHCVSTKAAFELGREAGREEGRMPLQRV